MKIKVLTLFFAFLIISNACSDSGPQKVPNPQVQVYETKAEEVQLSNEFVGQVFGKKDIAIRARVSGFLEGIHFQEGRFIDEGKLLYTIESAAYEAMSCIVFDPEYLQSLIELGYNETCYVLDQKNLLEASAERTGELNDKFEWEDETSVPTSIV